MAKIFDEILEKGMQAGHFPGKTSTAREWYRNTAKSFSRINETSLFKSADSSQFRNTLKIGQMFMFVYDPKHKSTLPYYDRVPLIFPINVAKNGFLGINFHYLPYPLRAKLMDALYEVTNNKKFDDTTKVLASYQILKASTKFSAFKPALKHYLNNHIRTRPMYIAPQEWDAALFLPVQKFVGATMQQVHKESKQIIRGKI